MTPTTAPRPWYRRPSFIAIAIVLIIAVGIGGGIWWFLKDDAPDAVDLESATRSLDASTTVADTEPTSPSDTATTVTDPPTAVAGTWTVDTSVGEFSFEESTGTFVGFRVEEELSTIGSTTAVGRTPSVSGEITFDGTRLTAATIEADMSELSTNESRRDGRVHEALDTAQFPTATFVLAEPIDLGDAVNTGAPTTVDATGDLTIHGVTTRVTLPLDAQLVGSTIVVVGSLDIALSAYGVEAPSAPIVVSVSDEAQIELQLFFAQA